MKQPSNLGRNVLWVFISRFGTQGLMVLFTVVLARRLGVVGFGEYALIAAAIFLGNALTTFGTDMLLIREIASRNDLSNLPAALVIQLALSGVFIILVMVGAPALPNQSAETVTGLKIYSFSLLPLAFFSIFTIALRGKQRMDAYMILNLLGSILQVTIVGLFLHPGGNIVMLVKQLLLFQIAGAILGGIICTLQIPGFWQTWHFSMQDTLALVRMSAPIALITLIGILYQKLSIYIVSMLDSPTVTGWFSAALRVVEASKIIHLAVFTALYPAMAQAGHPGRRTFSTVKMPWQGSFRKSWKLLLVGTGIISLVLFFFAAPLTNLLYGNEFAPTVPALRILTWILIPFTVNTFFSLSILAERNEQIVMRIQLIGLGILAGLNIWWIPKWGLIGACLASILAETTQAIIYLVTRMQLRQKAHNLFSAVIRF